MSLLSKREKDYFREEDRKEKERRSLENMERAKRVEAVLENATPLQKLKIRESLKKRLGHYGWDSATDSIKEALRAFDNKEYNNSDFLYWLEDKELVRTLSE